MWMTFLGIFGKGKKPSGLDPDPDCKVFSAGLKRKTPIERLAQSLDSHIVMDQVKYGIGHLNDDGTISTLSEAQFRRKQKHPEKVEAELDRLRAIVKPYREFAPRIDFEANKAEGTKNKIWKTRKRSSYVEVWWVCGNNPNHKWKADINVQRAHNRCPEGCVYDKAS